MKIGKWFIGIRYKTIPASSNWRYLLPKETQNTKRFTHPYWKHGVWWLKFYAYYPRKCRLCGEPMCKNGGIVERDNYRHKSIGVICKHCAASGASKYIEYPEIYKSYCAICKNNECIYKVNKS